MTVYTRTAFALLLSMGAAAAASQTPAPSAGAGQTPSTQGQTQDAPISVADLRKSLGSPVTQTASVAALDYDERVVVLRDDQGKDHALYVGNDVKRLKNLKVGDKVRVTYYMSLASRIVAPDEPSPTTGNAGAVVSAPGDKPGGTASYQERWLVTVQDVNRAQETVTVTGAKGRTFTFKAEDPSRLATLSKGDRIEVVFTAAAVIDVEPAQ